MKTLARPALRSAVTSISTMAGVRIRALTERHPIKPTSLRCHSAWQLNLGRPPLIDAEDLFRQPGPPQPRAFRQQLRAEAMFVGTRRDGMNIPVKLALSFVQTIGVGDGTSATSGANTTAEDTGAVGVGLNGKQ